MEVSSNNSILNLSQHEVKEKAQAKEKKQTHALLLLNYQHGGLKEGYRHHMAKAMASLETSTYPSNLYSCRTQLALHSLHPDTKHPRGKETFCREDAPKSPREQHQFLLSFSTHLYPLFLSFGSSSHLQILHVFLHRSQIFVIIPLFIITTLHEAHIPPS